MYISLQRLAYVYTNRRRCNKSFCTFFYLKKTLSNAKYEYAKIPLKILFEDALTMIVIDFGLLRSPYCKLSYLLADIKIVLKFDNQHMTPCAKIMANVGNVFIKRLQTLFYFLHFLTFFFIFI